MADSGTSVTLPKISMLLIRILRNVGINRKIRRRRQRTWTQWTEFAPFITNMHLGMVADDVSSEMHIFGSQIEGSTTPGLKSDLDIVFLTGKMIAVEDTQDSVAGLANLLMVADENTYPGYFKLQYQSLDLQVPLYGGDVEVNKMSAVDRNGRLVLNAHEYNFAIVGKFPGFSGRMEIHGPASTTVFPSGMTWDNISGIRLKRCVQQVIPWLQRLRYNKWITPNEFEYLLQREAFLVPVGCPLSPEKHNEWRISFTRLERELMWIMNDTQMTCYVLMKMINKCFITPTVGKSLSSYHCKTALFYLIDNTERSFWIPKNLLVGLNLLLKTICNWVDAGFCPNYFIPAENMFLGKVNGPLRRRLLSCLVSLMDQGFKYLTQITCDGVGQALSMACIGISSLHGIPQTTGELENTVVGCRVLAVIESYMELLKCFESTSVQNILTSLIQRYQTGSTPLQEGLSVLFRFFCTHIGCQLASSCLDAHTIWDTDLELAHTYLRIGSGSDVTSGRLKLAGFYLRLGYASLAEEVLNTVERDFNQYVSDVSAVNWVRIEDVTCEKILSEDFTFDAIYRKYIALSVVYLPSEIHCTLPPLYYEMFRSVGADPSVRDTKRNCYDWVIVDARPYMYFLQHQTYSVLGMNNQRSLALKNLMWSIKQKRTMHLETCLNLLAHCLRHDGLIDLATKCLNLSKKIKPEHKAAVS